MWSGIEVTVGQVCSGTEVTVWSGVVGYRGDCWSGVVGYRGDCWSGVVGYRDDCWSGVVGYRGDWGGSVPMRSDLHIHKYSQTLSSTWQQGRCINRLIRRSKGRVYLGSYPSPATHLRKGGRMIVLQNKKRPLFTDFLFEKMTPYFQNR